METFTEVKSFNVDYDCDACGGEMIAEDFYYPTSPPRYPHKCKECGTKLTLSSRYPKIVYRSI